MTGRRANMIIFAKKKPSQLLKHLPYFEHIMSIEEKQFEEK